MKGKTVFFVAVGIIAVIVIYYLFFYKKSGSTTTTGAPAAPAEENPCLKPQFLLTDAEYNAKVNLMMASIDQNIEWLADIRKKMGDTAHPCGGLSLNDCKKIDAIYVLEQQGYRKNPAGGYCKIG